VRTKRIEIGADSTEEEMRILRDDGKALAELLQGNFCYVDTVK
jgi:hypothetical protein